MSKLPELSGKEVKNFNFEVVRHKESHVALRKFSEGRKIITIVPLHKEIKPGTLLGILQLAKISREEFLKYV
jgi:predicted RNA binding protein YcfA (HicA-like mRNA interferase family)